MMTHELQVYYERRLSMMGDEAWNDLMDDVAEMYEATSRIDSITDEKSLFFKKGECSIMKWLLSLKEVSESAYQSLKDEDGENAA